MTCEAAREALHAELDEELTLTARAQLQDHMEGCRACRDALARLRDQKADIREYATRYLPRVDFEQTVRAALRKESSHHGNTPSTRPGWRWAAIAASVLLIASLGWNLALLQSRPSPPDLLAENLISSHIGSLMGTHLLDVPSTDQHTVKPWFNGKLDFSPDVKDLAAQGFPLAGGRIDYIAGRTVAALVYHRRQHVINLFTTPRMPTDAAVPPLSRQGFHLVSWDAAGMSYWAVSDISVAELDEFRSLFRK